MLWTLLFESRDGWFQADEDLEDPELERTVSSLQRALNFAKIKHTMASTTQYAKNVMRLPMRRHFKS
eukprot:12825078-Ditylum_brightwellii.AAC.1